MLRYFVKSLVLIAVAVVVTCGIYPGILWAIGQTAFPFQANGSIVRSADGKVIGSMLVAQPFTKDEYFQPRPSAASYDASATASASGYAPRRTMRSATASPARSVPIATYASGRHEGRTGALRPDVEAWFQAGQVPAANPHIVAQWADAAQHARAELGDRAIRTTAPSSTPGPRRIRRLVVQDWIKNNPATPQPKASDLAVVFFENFSNDNPGRFPSAGDQDRRGRQAGDVDRTRQPPAPTSSRSSSICGGPDHPTWR